MLRRKIKPCKGLVQLVGQRFGFGPTNPRSDAHAISYTQYELHFARELGIKVWPVILAGDFPVDAPNDESKAHRGNQKYYRKLLAPDPEDDRTAVPLYHRVGNLDELEIIILKLRNELEALRAEESKKHRRIFLLTTFTALAVVIIACLVLWLRSDVRDAQSIATRSETKIDALSEAIDRIPVLPPRPESQEASRALLFTELEKKHGLPSGFIAANLPAYAAKEAADRSFPPIHRAKAFLAARNYSEAERFAIAAVAEAKQAIPLKKSEIIDALVIAGISASEQQANTKALSYFTEASAMTDKAADALRWAHIHYSIAIILLARGESAHAESLLRQVESICSKNLGLMNPLALSVGNSLLLSLYQGSPVCTSK